MNKLEMIIKHTKKALQLVCLIIILFPGCEEATVNEIEDLDPDTGLTHEDWDSIEAFDLALFWDELLLPTDSTYESQLYHVNYLRTTWSDSLPFLNTIRFLAPWVIGQVLVGFEDSTVELINSDVYTGFNELAPELRPDSMRMPDFLGNGVLYYEEKYHPIRLAELLQNLSGIEFVEPNGRFFVEWSTFPIFPGMINGEIAYIFHENYSSSLKHYFRYSDGEPEYLGIVSQDSDSVLIAEVQIIGQQWYDRSSW